MSSPKFEKFGNFILLEKLAAGGMAEVFLAKKIGASGVQKFLALKRILPQFSESEEFIRMFKEEAKIAVHLSHSNVISIHEFGVEESRFYLSMEYCEGRNLRQILNKMKTKNVYFSPSQIVYVIKEVAAGLDHAHRCLDGSTGKPLNIVHRDISPQNIMLTFEGETKIVDFGIAKASTQIEHTRAGTLKGKYGYMSPEQAEGQSIDYRTDIFSLGIVLWELLAKDRLFLGNNEIETLKKIRECKIPSLREINSAISSELESIVMRSLTRDKNLRYQSSSELQRDLNRYLNRTDPDFSTQDFSVFIKTLFSQDILDSRQRLIKYASYIPEENTLFTKSATSKKSLEDEMKTHESSEFNHTSAGQEELSNPRTGFEDISEVKIHHISEDKLPNFNRKEPTASGAAGGKSDRTRTPTFLSPTSIKNTASGSFELSHATTTRTSRRLDFDPYGLQRKKTGILKSISILLILALAYWFFSDSKAPELLTKQKVIGEFCRNMQISHCMNWGLDFGQENLASSHAPLHILTTPPGAEIYLNGVRTGHRTPSHIDVPLDSPFQISLRLAGYQQNQERFSRHPGQAYQVQLSKASVGYLQISVLGNGHIFVDDVHVGSNSARVPVPPGKKVVVRAVHPITEAFDEKEVEVQEDRVLPVVLSPALN